jgi:hypothetical protein
MKTPSHSRASLLLVVRAATLCLFLLAGPACAVSSVSLCASNAKELNDDLVAASDNGMYAGDYVEIDLVAGTYETGAATSNGPFKYSSTAATGQLILFGGWMPNCFGRPVDASLTILDGNHATQVLNISNDHGETQIDTLTIRNGNFAGDGGGLSINPVGDQGNNIFVNNVIFSGNHAGNKGGGFAINTSSASAQINVGFDGNVLFDNDADGGAGAGILYADGPKAYVQVSKNTVYKNTTTKSGEGGGLYCCGQVETYPLVNGSIFWDNTNYGLYLYGNSMVDIEYNDVGTVSGSPSEFIGNLSTDPLFVDADNRNLRLAGNSPLLGYVSESNFPSGSYDLTGEGEPSTGFYDIGAYEDTVFTDHGFESQ